MAIDPIAAHFGPPGRQLYGVHHPPSGAGHRQAVVICQPLGNEYQRTHRAIAQLAARLSGQGFDVLRFDWSGTGDSWGSLADVSTETWLEDVALAVDEARRRTRAPRVDLVGLRIGVTLAVLGSDRVDRVDRLVLWEPVVSGAAFMAEAFEEQRELWSRLPHVPAARTGPDVEVCGYDYPARLVASIEAMRLNRISPRCAKALVVGSVPEGIDQFRSAWESDRPLQHEQVGGPKFWRGDAQRAVLATEPIQFISAWLENGRAP
jgi:exosortase A-associated hydrolase 2